MKHSEFWVRMDHHLGRSYARSWAETQVLSGLDERTVAEALDTGVPPLRVWREVWAYLELPASER